MRGGSRFAVMAGLAAAAIGSMFGQPGTGRAPGLNAPSVSPQPAVPRGGGVAGQIGQAVLGGGRATPPGWGVAGASPNGGRRRPVTRGARHASLRSRSRRQKAAKRAKLRKTRA